jgi:hypothetical protein
MDIFDQDDLNETERQLASWKPAQEGLDSEAMLYQVGYSAGRKSRTRWFWPALSLLLTGQIAALTVWAFSERAERQALVSQLQENAPVKHLPVPPATVEAPESSYTPSSEDFLHVTRQAEQNLDRWFAGPQPTTQMLAPPPEPSIFKRGTRDEFPDL